MKKIIIDKDLPKTLPLFLRDRVLKNGDKNLQASKNKKGEYEFFTYKQVYSEIIAFAMALKNIGIKKGSNIAIMSDNRREWLITDFAIQTLGCADVPRGCDSLGSEIRFILSFADCETSFFENEKQILKVLENIKEVPLLKTVILYDHLTEETENKLSENNITLYYFDQLLSKAMQEFNQNPEEITQLIEKEMYEIQEDDVCTIIFTSGTTGTPKGVMLTHKNYMAQMSAAYNFVPGKPGENWMTILPIWHSFERLAMYATILIWNCIAYSKPIARTLLADMATIKPHRMCGVPRLWEALVNGINQTMEKKGGITLKLYKFFIAVGIKYADAKDYVISNIFSAKKRNKFADFMRGIIPFLALFPLRALGELLVYRKIKERFGGKIQYVVSGGGSLAKDTDDFFRAIGLPMLNAYGMTETAPGMAFRDLKHPQKNCIGDLFPTLEFKIVQESQGQIVSKEPLAYGQKGLILVRGANVMKGYYKRPDLTAQIIDEDGFLNTGDIGLISEGSMLLNITGRAKDTIVLSGGENIEPVLIEQAMCVSEFIESAVVVGQDKKYLSSLIVPCKAALIKYAEDHGIHFSSYESLLKNEHIHNLILTCINKLVSLEKGFRACEKIYKICLLAKSFEVGKELSAKQEIMRFKIRQEYKDEIEEMYA
ncbi:MAG: long-chain fatty acid--CoA ligase [Treponema sp.]|nr:long-chain fatty acid--CoA ligase [Treponema sp.]